MASDEGFSKAKIISVLGSIGAVFLVIFVLWVGFSWVISPGPDEFYVLISQTGETLPPGHILAKPGQKGIQKQLHAAGWAFYNPITWSTERHKMTVIPSGKVGILKAEDGEEMPPGQALAKVLERDPLSKEIMSCQRGTIEDVLMPGSYRLNPHWFHVEIQDAVMIDAGKVGIVTALTGSPMDANAVLAKPGQRGVQEATLPPGTHYLNPYVVKVDAISLRSHLLELLKESPHGDDSIEFPSSDGFPIIIDATIEWRIHSDKVAEVFTRIGNEQTILDNIIRPNARSISRMEGSKYKATDFIQGANREKFEQAFFHELSKVCDAKGVEIMRALVRKINVPEDISRPIRESEVARQERIRNLEQMEAQKTAAQFAEQKAMVEQQTLRVKAETEKLVRETEAKQKLSVAETDLATAKKEAEATVMRGKAEADVLFAKKEAEAKGFEAVVRAFGGGDKYAMYQFTQMIAKQTTFVFAPVGQGTFWTDPQSFFKLAGAKAVSEAAEHNK